MIDKLIPVQERNAEIQRIYRQFQNQYELTKMPDLYINWLSQCDNIQIVNDTGITLIAELCINDVDWYLHKLDIEPTLYHEFTHIWDMVDIRKVGDVHDLIHPCLSEIHAAYVEFAHRLSITGANSVALKTQIPVRSETESIERYLSTSRTSLYLTIQALFHISGNRHSIYVQTCVTLDRNVA